MMTTTTKTTRTTAAAAAAGTATGIGIGMRTWLPGPPAERGPRPHCGQSDSAVRRDRSPRCGRCGSTPSCTWDAAAGCAARGIHGRTGTSRRTCTHRPPRTDGTAPSCIWKWKIELVKVLVIMGLSLKSNGYKVISKI